MFRRTLVFLVLANCVSATPWPTYRHDNRRSAASPNSLDLPLKQAWTLDAGPPQQAWTGPAKWDAYSSNDGLQSMRNFDPCHFTTAAHNLVFFGSSTDNAVHCLDAQTGKEKWLHFTNSSVRFPPTIVGERAWFGSDDGHIYCANALTGETIWKKRAAPSDRLIPSNGKLISPWPIRTGITVENDRAYFAASLLPWKESYFWCLDATNGEQAYLTEHTGVTMQGAILAGADRLYIPQGRAAPIVLNQKTGKATGTIGQAGGTFCLLTEDNQLIAGPPNQREKDEQLRLADPNSGKRLATFNNTTRVVVDQGKAYLHSVDQLQCLDLARKGELETTLSSQKTDLKTLDPKAEANLSKINELKEKISSTQAEIQACILWKIPHPAPFELVLAGDQLIVGLDNQVTILNSKTGQQLWQSEVTGKAFGLTPAQGRLIVSTDLGHIHTFTPSKKKP